jgi:hypothetical protein
MNAYGLSMRRKREIIGKLRERFLRMFSAGCEVRAAVRGLTKGQRTGNREQGTGNREGTIGGFFRPLKRAVGVRFRLESLTLSLPGLRRWRLCGMRRYANGIKSAFSLLKRGVLGSWHKVSAKHLSAYLEEMTFRFNRRGRSDLFVDTLRHMITADPLTFQTLTA